MGVLMPLDMLSWMGGTIFTALLLGGILRYVILGETITSEKQPIAMDDDERWAKLLNKEQ